MHAGQDPATWRSISNTVGIASIVPNGQKPSFLDDDLIQELKARCDAASIFRQSLAAEIGAKVKIISGPFTSIIATVEQLDKDGRVKLLFEQLSRKAQFWVDPEEIISS